MSGRQSIINEKAEHYIRALKEIHSNMKYSKTSFQDITKTLKDLLVNDIVYTPMKTSLIREAELANAEVVYGYKMLLYQGIRSFEIWLGRVAPVDVMEKALLDVLGI